MPDQYELNITLYVILSCHSKVCHSLLPNNQGSAMYINICLCNTEAKMHTIRKTMKTINMHAQRKK